jgi:replicative superfamily II helicase
MVQFKKHLEKAVSKAPINPIELYESLDRASDKGPLRPAQTAVLGEWHKTRRAERDVIVKLHTGQGKTLIGLLMLQSKLNEGIAPAVYLCPNNFLVAQTAAQAKQFGLKCVQPDPELPTQFLDGKAILVTSVQKLFNGLTKFGMGLQSLSLGALVMDDSHACVDAIKDATMIRLNKDSQPYSDLLNLFAQELERQGIGTYADIRNHRSEAFLPVPYWDWIEKHPEVARILSKYVALDQIKFSWPILKDIIRDCLCVVSGTELEIEPYAPPLSIFGSYAKASHRIFMSATVTNDSFLVKGLGLQEAVITHPLTNQQESWSGEKMILIPSLIDEQLTREEIVQYFARPFPKRGVGVVVLAPSTYGCQDWAKYGAAIANKKTIGVEVERLMNGDYSQVLVIVNRYDGIDLPDESCRVLIFDSKPHSERLVDIYVESCRATSDIIATKTARMVEQGLGRSVRGEKDYCVFVLIGSSLIKTVRSIQDRIFFSNQTKAQIEIGMKIAEYAKEEITSGEKPKQAFLTLMNQCLGRDQAWKDFYAQEMNQVKPETEKPKLLDVFAAELKAETYYSAGNYDAAANTIQALIDKHVTSREDRGWYLQEMARYKYLQSKTNSNEVQVSAHSLNHYVLRPKYGMQFKKVGLLSQKRVENIMAWIGKFADFEQLFLSVNEILTDLQFGVKADDFEHAVDSLGAALGFDAQRPDKEWKEGPDNLWAVRDNEYLLIECKSEVDSRRSEINKDETGQMNNAIAWFGQHYGERSLKSMLIIPTKTIGRGAGFNGQVEIMRNSSLKKLNKNAEAFFREFKAYDLKDLSETRINQWIDVHDLSIDSLLSKYSEPPKII